MEESVYQKIEAYLGGDMAPEEQHQFEELMANDPELQNEVALYNEINHHLNEESWLTTNAGKNNKTKQELEEYIKSDEATQIKSKLQQAGKVYKQSRKKPSKITFFVGALAAVFVAGLLVTSLFFNKTSSDDLYATYYSANDLPSLIKRGAEDEVLSTAIVEFKNGEHEKAIQSFKTYHDKQDLNDPLVYAYIGFSYLELNKINEAIQSFDRLLNSDSIDSSKALWYKSLVYLKTDDMTNAKNTLSKIIANPESFNHKKAIELLEDLDKLSSYN